MRAITYLAAAVLATGCNAPLFDADSATSLGAAAVLDPASKTISNTDLYYNAGSDELVVQYSTVHPMLAHLGPETLDVFADGRVISRRHESRGGTSESTMRPNELHGLLTALIETGVTAYDPEAVTRAKSSNNLRFSVSDPDQIEIRLYLHRRSGTGKSLAPSRITIAAESPGAWARQFPSQPGLQSAAAADQLLRSMVQTREASK